MEKCQKIHFYSTCNLVFVDQTIKKGSKWPGISKNQILGSGVRFQVLKIQKKGHLRSITYYFCSLLMYPNPTQGICILGLKKHFLTLLTPKSNFISQKTLSKLILGRKITEIPIMRPLQMQWPERYGGPCTSFITSIATKHQ